MLIAIPSCGRPDWKKQVTIRNFQIMKCKREVVLCIPGPKDSREGRNYRNNVLGILGDRVNLSVEYVPETHNGISRTREWIMTDLAKQRGERYVFMLDDDMDFCYRPVMNNPALETIKDLPRFEEIFKLVDQWLAEGFIHVGLAARQGSNHFNGPETYRDITRMMNAYAYDTLALQDLGVDIGRNAVMHDFDLTLQLLRLGYPNRVSYQYVWNQRGSGSEGGCSLYRTNEVQRNSALQLKADHPDFVSIVIKSTGTVWRDMEERSDVNVQWQKAYEEGKRVRDQRNKCA